MASIRIGTRARRRAAGRRLLAAAVPVSLLLVLPRLAAGDAGNFVESIRSSGSEIEIQVQSATPFSDGALPLVLRVGDREFWRSKYVADGDASKRIFLVTTDEFAELEDGAPLTVFYGSSGSDSRAFGPLDKGLLDR